VPPSPTLLPKTGKDLHSKHMVLSAVLQVPESHDILKLKVLLHAPTGMQTWTWCSSLVAGASEQSQVLKARQQHCCTLYAGLLHKQLEYAPVWHMHCQQALSGARLARHCMHFHNRPVPLCCLTYFCPGYPQNAPQMQAYFQWFRALLFL